MIPVQALKAHANQTNQTSDRYDPRHCRPMVAVGSCVLGEPVRFNGAHKRRHSHLEIIKPFFEFVSICPEIGIGMGVPREPIRLVEIEGALHARDSETQIKDYTAPLRDYADQQLLRFPELCGYVLVKGSPSCGYERVPRYNVKGNVIASDQAGIYAQQLMMRDPLLPLEEDGRLNDHRLRESFISRVYLYHHWRQLNKEGLTPDKLIKFYARYKYLVMAHSVPIYQQLGPMLANLNAVPLNECAQQVIALIMEALKKSVTRRSQTNVLQHLQGYLKRKLSASEKQTLQQAIEQYRQGIVPLIAPMTLLKHHFEQQPDSYIDGQVFMQPYPEELALRSHLH